jgi:hypothetical protein
MNTLPKESTSQRMPYSGRQRRNVSLHLGGVLLALGMILSAHVLEWAFLPEGTLVGTSRRAAAWIACRLLLAGLGIFLLVRRPRITTVDLCAFLVVGLISAAFGTLVLQALYVPPRIECGWKSLAPRTEQNQLGFRGRPIQYSSNDFVIVLLGDSQVEGMALPFESMPERLLESALNSQGGTVKVFSIGAGGYGQDQEWLALKEYFRKYRADLVILWQTPGNDVWNNVFATHMYNRNPKPTCWLEGDELRGPTESLGQPLANSRFVPRALWQRVFGLPRRDKQWERRLPEPYRPLDHYEGPVNREWQERWDVNRGRMRDENLATEKSHMSVMLSPPSKRTEYGLALTRSLSKKIEEVVVAQKGRLVVLQIDEHLLKAEDDMHILNGKYYRVSKRQFQENWRTVNEGLQTVIIDVTEKDWRVGPDDGHLNKKANEQVFRDLAKRLQGQIPHHAP